MDKFTLSYPIKPFTMTQKFDERAYLDWYKQNNVTFSGHNGVDLHAYHGQPIFASHDGFAYYEVDSKQGHGVNLISDKPYGENYYKTIYWHLIGDDEPEFKSPVRNATQTNPLPVKRGDIIGYADSTGLSTGTHLHWGLKRCLVNGYTLDRDNGYQGAIDPMPFLETKHIFNFDMRYGEFSDEVKFLQEFLVKRGYMTPIPSGEVGWYGKKTKNAVYQFMIDNRIASWWTLFWNQGKYVGSLTRRVLNVL